MLSYQHAYHAGNLADLHKHALLAWMLDYLTAKSKPLSYIETHAGRGLYDLAGPESEKTGEARAGITRALSEAWLPDDHPLSLALDQVRRLHGPDAYPGSPLIARYFLRPEDEAHLAELHPARARGPVPRRRIRTSSPAGRFRTGQGHLPAHATAGPAADRPEL